MLICLHVLPQCAEFVSTLLLLLNLKYYIIRMSLSLLLLFVAVVVMHKYKINYAIILRCDRNAVIKKANRCLLWKFSDFIHLFWPTRAAATTTTLIIGCFLCNKCKWVLTDLARLMSLSIYIGVYVFLCIFHS